MANLLKLSMLIALVLSVSAGDSEKLSKSEKAALLKFSKKDFKKQLEKNNKLFEKVEEKRFEVTKKHQKKHGSKAVQDIIQGNKDKQKGLASQYFYYTNQLWDGSEECETGKETMTIAEKTNLCFWDSYDQQYVQMSCDEGSLYKFGFASDPTCSHGTQLYSLDTGVCYSYESFSYKYECPGFVETTELFSDTHHRYPVRATYTDEAGAQVANLEKAVRLTAAGKKSQFIWGMPGYRKCRKQKIDGVNGNKAVYLKSLCVGAQELESRYYYSYKDCAKFGNSKKAFYSWTNKKDEVDDDFWTPSQDDDDDTDDYHGVEGDNSYNTFVCYGM